MNAWLHFQIGPTFVENFFLDFRVIRIFGQNLFAYVNCVHISLGFHEIEGQFVTDVRVIAVREPPGHLVIMCRVLIALLLLHYETKVFVSLHR